jgi:hypothetical protein
MEEGGVVVGVLEWQLNLFSSVYQFLVGYPRGKAENCFGEEIFLKSTQRFLKCAVTSHQYF